MKTKWILTAAVAVMMTAPAAMAGEHGKMEFGKGEHHAKMMEKVDTDGDGKVSREEFINSHAARFDKMDTDGDGFLSEEEMKAARDAKHEKMKEWREKHGKHMDEATPEDAPDTDE